jgi:3,4-dihydroxy 2-butanone 4-phosphate synthase/GTP cyclohydrolase II
MSINISDKTIHNSLEKVNAAIHALQSGNMVLLSDDDDREGEADFVISACKVTAKHLNTMCQSGSGIICVSISAQKAHHLNLPLMQTNSWNDNHQKTAFTCSVEASKGVTTGVGAKDRLTTIQLFANENTGANDFVRPGHIFPLQAHPNGIYGRRGHTEGSLELMQLANLSDAAVICEVMDQDGEPMKGQALKDYAINNDYPIITMQQLTDYLCDAGKQIQESARAFLPTQYGHFYHRAITDVEGKTHSVLTTFDPNNKDHIPPSCLVRIHSSCATGDLFHSLRCDCHEQLQYALQRIAKEGGIFVYMQQEGRGIGLVNKMKAYNLQDTGLDTIEANHALGLAADMRDYSLACTLIKQSNVHKIKLMTNNPDKIEQCTYHGLTILKQVPMPSAIQEHNATYLKTKVDKCDHLNAFVPQQQNMEN